MTTPSRNSPTRGSGRLPACERQRQSRVLAPGREREREGAAEAQVHVRHPAVARRGAEALHRRRADHAEGLAHVAPERDELVVGDRHPLDRLAAFRLDHRSRDRVQAAAFEIAEDVHGELLAGADLLHERLRRGAGEEEVELLPVLRAEDVARPEAAPGLHEDREWEVGGQLVLEPGCGRADPALLQEKVRHVLVVRPLGHLGVGQEHERAELASVLGQDRHVEVGEGDDQIDAVLGDGCGKSGHVARVVDTRREEVPVGRVERGREGVQVGRDRLASGAAEGGDDVDALAGAREEDGGQPCRQPPVSPR